MIYKFLAETSSFVIILPLIICIKRYRSFARLFKIISLHVVVVAVTEFISRWLWLQKHSNLFLLHIYTVWELEILSLFYFELLKQHIKRWVIPFVMIGFICFALIDSMYFHNTHHFNVFARSVECIIIITYAVYYLYKQLETGKSIFLLKDPVLLINAAFLFYFSASFFLFLFSNYIMAETFKTYMVWTMHTIALWILYTTIGIALWKAGKR